MYYVERVPAGVQGGVIAEFYGHVLYLLLVIQQNSYTLYHSGETGAEYMTSLSLINWRG